MVNPVASIKNWIDSYMQDVNTSFPVEVVAINNGRVDLQPLIMGRNRGLMGLIEHIKLPIIQDVEIWEQGGGGYASSMPIAIGDQGIALCFQRDIRSWKLSRLLSRQRTTRRFHQDDCVYIGQFKPRDKALPIDGAYITNPNGNYFSVKADKIETDLDIHCKVIHADNLVTPVVPDYNNHTHGGVQTGGGNTGVPQ